MWLPTMPRASVFPSEPRRRTPAGAELVMHCLRDLLLWHGRRHMMSVTLQVVGSTACWLPCIYHVSYRASTMWATVHYLWVTVHLPCELSSICHVIYRSSLCGLSCIYFMIYHASTMWVIVHLPCELPSCRSLSAPFVAPRMPLLLLPACISRCLLLPVCLSCHSYASLVTPRIIFLSLTACLSCYSIYASIVTRMPLLSLPVCLSCNSPYALLSISVCLSCHSPYTSIVTPRMPLLSLPVCPSYHSISAPPITPCQPLLSFSVCPSCHSP